MLAQLLFAVDLLRAASFRDDAEEATERVARVYAAIDLATSDLGHVEELQRICHRESWCNLYNEVGQHERDAQSSKGRRRWKGAVAKGILRPDECPEHALGPDPSRWSTWGVFGQTAAAVGHLDGCLGPEAMSDPLNAARATIATWDRLCDRMDMCSCEDRVVWWAGIGRWPRLPRLVRLHKVERICGRRPVIERLAAYVATVPVLWRL